MDTILEKNKFENDFSGQSSLINMTETNSLRNIRNNSEDPNIHYRNKFNLK